MEIQNLKPPYCGSFDRLPTKLVHKLVHDFMLKSDIKPTLSQNYVDGQLSQDFPIFPDVLIAKPDVSKLTHMA